MGKELKTRGGPKHLSNNHIFKVKVGSKSNLEPNTLKTQNSNSMKTKFEEKDEDGTVKAS